MKKHLLTLTFLSCAFLLLAGCAEKSSSTSSSTSEPTVDYTAEAERNITAENMDQHLEALESEIAADEASQIP